MAVGAVEFAGGLIVEDGRVALDDVEVLGPLAEVELQVLYEVLDLGQTWQEDQHSFTALVLT